MVDDQVGYGVGLWMGLDVLSLLRLGIVCFLLLI